MLYVLNRKARKEGAKGAKKNAQNNLLCVLCKRLCVSAFTLSTFRPDFSVSVMEIQMNSFSSITPSGSLKPDSELLVVRLLVVNPPVTSSVPELLLLRSCLVQFTQCRSLPWVNITTVAVWQGVEKPFSDKENEPPRRHDSKKIIEKWTELINSCFLGVVASWRSFFFQQPARNLVGNPCLMYLTAKPAKKAQRAQRKMLRTTFFAYSANAFASLRLLFQLFDRISSSRPRNAWSPSGGCSLAEVSLLLKKIVVGWIEERRIKR